MTVAALRRLLDEIDHQGGPEAARQWRLHIPDDPQEGPVAMTTAFTPPSELVSALMPKTAAALTPEPKPIPVGQLLKWGDDHDDEEVRDQAARARVLLTALRRRHDADQELTAITSKREQLEKELAALQAREAELAPPKKAGRRTPTSPDTKAARAWAAANGVDCPPRGRVPKTVMDAWRASQQQIGDPAA